MWDNYLCNFFIETHACTLSMERKCGPYTKAQYKFHSKVTFKGVGREFFFNLLWEIKCGILCTAHPLFESE